jgi:hypothetical protein
MQQRLGINNLIRGTTFFQHAGVSIVYVFMPILAQNLTTSIFEVGLTIASFLRKFYPACILAGFPMLAEKD